MGAIVVPFRGTGGKQRLSGLSPDAHDRVVIAMLQDVLAATMEVSRTVVVTGDDEGRRVAEGAGADVVDDPGGGQSAAVAAALGLLPHDSLLIVNADLPCVVPYDLRSLVASTPRGGIAYVASQDGRTNALSLPGPELFQPLYGPNSAKKFKRAAEELGVEAVAVTIPNIEDDVDTREDLERIGDRAGPHTRAAVHELRAA